jgi:hypothetical protein
MSEPCLTLSFRNAVISPGRRGFRVTFVSSACRAIVLGSNLAMALLLIGRTQGHGVRKSRGAAYGIGLLASFGRFWWRISIGSTSEEEESEGSSGGPSDVSFGVLLLRLDGGFVVLISLVVAGNAFDL